MTKLGMDAGTIRSLADQMDRLAAHLESIIGSVEGSVHQAGSLWFGSDSAAFRDDWARGHRPALTVLAHDIRSLAGTARTNAAEQDSASGATGGSQPSPGPRHRPLTYTQDGTPTPQQLALAERLARNSIRMAGHEFPGATDQLKAWLARVEAGGASSADVEAMRRFAVLIEIAHLQRDTVSDAAHLALDSFKDADKSIVDSVVSVIGAIPGANEAKVGGSVLHQGVHYAGDIALHSAEDLARDRGMDLLLKGLTDGKADGIVNSYDHSADAYLQSIGERATGVTGLHDVNMSNAFSSTEILQGRLAEQDYSSIANEATNMITGDGSIPQTIGTNVIGAVPIVGNIYDGLSSAASAFHGSHAAEVGIGALKVATVDSMSGLVSAANALEIGQ